MYKILTPAIIVFLGVCTSFCDRGRHRGDIATQVKVDTFLIQYSFDLHGKKKTASDFFYVGYGGLTQKKHGKNYRSFLFGDSPTSIIAYVNIGKDSLTYLTTEYPEAGFTKADPGSRVLLYFDKPVGYEWSVDIGSSYLWKRKIKFSGIEQLIEGEVYKFDLSDLDDQSQSYRSLESIYYSKTEGFLKFTIKTHWFPVDVIKYRKE